MYVKEIFSHHSSHFLFRNYCSKSQLALKQISTQLTLIKTEIWHTCMVHVMFPMNEGTLHITTIWPKIWNEITIVLSTNKKQKPGINRVSRNEELLTRKFDLSLILITILNRKFFLLLYLRLTKMRSKLIMRVIVTHGYWSMDRNVWSRMQRRT